MKSLLIFLSLLATVEASSQYDSLGIDNSDYFTEDEANFVNTLLQGKRGDFDFHNKKILFITGSGGSRIHDKYSFFQAHVLPWTLDGNKPSISFIKLSPEEKVKSGGYDVFMLTWVKYFPNGQKKRIIRRISK